MKESQTNQRRTWHPHLSIYGEGEVVHIILTDMPTFENQKEESLTTEARNPARACGGALQAPPLGSGVKPQPFFIMVPFELHRWPLVIGFF